MLAPIRNQLRYTDKNIFLIFKNLLNGGRVAIITSIRDPTDGLPSASSSDQIFLRSLRKYTDDHRKVSDINREPLPPTKASRILQKLQLKALLKQDINNAAKTGIAADDYAVITGTVISKIPANETELWTTEIILTPEAIRRQNYTREIYNKAVSAYKAASKAYNDLVRL